MSRKILLLILAIAALVNLVGAFGPELGFDALWYHLTIPKLYLAAGKIYHIPGGLLYYSELPRLTEILYMFLPAHFLSWGAGIGATIVTYFMARKFLDRTASLLACLIFYATPLVGWQSGSAYVDLFRTFFEVLAVYLVISKKPILAGLAIGLAISTKTLALASLIPLLLLTNKRVLFLATCFVVIIPWFLSAYLNTGFPFYPIGAGILDPLHSLNFDVWNLPKLFGDFWKLWLSSEDPISPIYLIILPFVLLNFRRLPGRLVLYAVLSYLIWFIVPRTGGGRFILPYLPIWAVLAAMVTNKRRILVLAIIVISFINLSYRAVAISRLIPYFLGRETKTAYLCRNLDLTVTYVNCNNFKPMGVVLIKNLHNLYYVDFPFIHETWYRGEKYNYILQ